jgi:hypothetical protein
VANDTHVMTNYHQAVTITLSADDDGLPNPPAALTYSITSLPVHGTLTDPSAGAITAVPYMLVGHGSQVVFHPTPYYGGQDSFTFQANDGGTPPSGGDSNTATVSVTIGGVLPVYSFPLDTNPGWTTQGQWAFGQPTGGGTHNLDPTSGHTGENVYGYNLNGDYTSSMPVYYLTTTAVDCSNLTGTELRFWRWLGVESASFDHANVAVSNDGTSWTTVWSHTGTTAIADTAWTQQTYSIGAVADRQATVYVRWGMGPSDSSVTYPGWNLDDIEIWGATPPTVPGDMNCDGVVNFADINAFVLYLSDLSTWQTTHSNCPPTNGDINQDGTYPSFKDINPFVSLLTGGG